MKPTISSSIQREIFSLRRHHQWLRQLALNSRRKASSKLRWAKWIFIIGLLLSLIPLLPDKKYVAQITNMPAAEQPITQPPAQVPPPTTPAPQYPPQGVITTQANAPQIQAINNEIMYSQAILQQHQQLCQQQIAAHQQQQRFLAADVANAQIRLQTAEKTPNVDPFALQALREQAAIQQHNIAIIQQEIDAAANACHNDQTVLQQYIQNLMYTRDHI